VKITKAQLKQIIKEEVLKEAHWLTYTEWQKVFKESPGLLPELRRRVFGKEAKTGEILRFLRDVVDGVEGLRLSFTDPEGIEDLKLDFEAWKEEKEQNVVNLDFMIDEPPLTEELEDVVLVKGYGQMRLDQVKNKLIQMIVEAAEDAQRDPPSFAHLNSGVLFALYKTLKEHGEV